MRMTRLMSVLLTIVFLLAVCPAPDGDASSGEPAAVLPADGDMLRINVTVGESVFEARLYDNESVRALAERLPLTLEMADYAGQEKVIALPFELPSAPTESPEIIRAGEIYLWSGNQLVMFYTTFSNSYGGYVRLGAVEDADGFASALSAGEVTVTLDYAGPGRSGSLVAYFSCTGNTEYIAGMIARSTGADMYEITPETPYTAADLDYGDPSSRSSLEQSDPAARPALAGTAPNIEAYDTVFLGYPIWWGEAPKVISTFLESHDFGDITIVPFCTSGSSGVGSSDTHLHGLCAGSASWMPGKRFSSAASEQEVGEWLDGLGLSYGRGHNERQE